MLLTIRSRDEVDRHLETIRVSAERARASIAADTGGPLDLMWKMKFEAIGFHPIEDRPLNLVEQVNQTWTYTVALAATRKLFDLHPDAGGFHVAPGAHMSIPLDIMSVAEGLVGAETFATVHPRNNGKLAADLAKMAARAESHRYVFFCCPRFPGFQRLHAYELPGVQVWSVEAR